MMPVGPRDIAGRGGSIFRFGCLESRANPVMVQQQTPRTCGPETERRIGRGCLRGPFAISAARRIAISVGDISGFPAPRHAGLTRRRRTAPRTRPAREVPPDSRRRRRRRHPGRGMAARGSPLL